MKIKKIDKLKLLFHFKKNIYNQIKKYIFLIFLKNI